MSACASERTLFCAANPLTLSPVSAPIPSINCLAVGVCVDMSALVPSYPRILVSTYPRILAVGGVGERVNCLSTRLCL